MRAALAASGGFYQSLRELTATYCVRQRSGYDSVNYSNAAANNQGPMSDDETTRFLGTWKSDPEDPKGVMRFGSVTLKFGADGVLLYITHQAGRDEVMRLTFQVEQGYIVTDQPSQQRIERTEYEFMPNGKLLLSFGGGQSRYIRVG